jgi:hypothetical protein
MSEQGKRKINPNREIAHYMASSIFAIQMRLESVASRVKQSKEAKLRDLILAEREKADQELDLCGEIFQFIILELR